MWRAVGPRSEFSAVPSTASKRVLRLPKRTLCVRNLRSYSTWTSTPARKPNASTPSNPPPAQVPEPNAVALNWNGTLACCPYTDGVLRVYKLNSAPASVRKEPAPTEEFTAACRLQGTVRGHKDRKLVEILKSPQGSAAPGFSSAPASPSEAACLAMGLPTSAE